MPVKFLPKMSCSGGRSSFGVVVWIMDRDSGLIPGSLAISASLDCMLYGLGQCVRCNDLRENSALDLSRQVCADLKTLCRAIEEANSYRPGPSSLRRAPLPSRKLKPVYLSSRLKGKEEEVETEDADCSIDSEQR